MLLVFIFVAALIVILGAIITCNVKLNIYANSKGSKAVVSVFIYNKICILKTDVSKISKKMDKNKIPEWAKDKLFIIKTIRAIKVKADILKIKIKIGTTDAGATAVLVGIIESIVSAAITILNINVNVNSSKYYLKVIPDYSNKYVFALKLKCIINFNLLHTISTIYKCIKDWRREKYGRKSSNRRAYGNSNG